MRRLIVNADDFGQSPGINAGVIRSHEEGIVTSASLMVRWPAAPAAAAYAEARPKLSVGLHVDLAEWARVNGEWIPRYRVVDEAEPVAVEREILRQLDRFREMTGRNPTHLDGHQHVQRTGHPRLVLEELAAELGVVLRDLSGEVRYEGGFYGRAPDGPYPEGITAGRLIEILSGLPEGTTELGCHPGLGADVESDYAEERSLEVRALCDPVVRQAIDRLGIELMSFSELPSRSR